MSVMEKAWNRLQELGMISDQPGYLERTFLSDANRRAAELVMSWMQELGMITEHAIDGTFRGIVLGKHPTAKPLLIGSHIDTVIDAGKYDGALGIVAALAAMEKLRELDVKLPFPVHVLGFSDEEGVRFHSTYLGSRSLVGELDAATLALRDHMGTTLKDVLTREGWSKGASKLRYAPGSVLGYLELHIEQGRVLEELNQPLAAVTAIAGQTRLMLTLTGRADHAGTTPMPLRRDALAGAAECMLAIEKLACESPPLVATVGKMEIHPGASNSVPQTARFTLDFRHPDDALRLSLLGRLHEKISAANSRHLALEWQVVQDSDAVACDTDLTHVLLDVIEEHTGERISLPSGAGHDGVILSQLGPIAMMFLRCRDGLSHHPDEYASPEDLASGIEVLVRFLQSYSSKHV
jgi:allantoate deiminase